MSNTHRNSTFGRVSTIRRLTTRRLTTRRLTTGMVAMIVMMAVVVSAGAQTSDTISIVKDDDGELSNSEIASRLAEETFRGADRVLIGRDDEFADAMTSGLLQSASPLLLVPSDGPVPDRVLQELELFAPEEVLLLGGTAAISSRVEEEFRDAGFPLDRAFGTSRFETATEVADLGAPSPDTVLIARAFAADGAGDPTQAFADAMAAGGWAADEGWPILLTQTEVLTGTTRQWLEDNAIDTAFVLGGTAAVSSDVEKELAGLVGTVERVAGSDRFGTAIEIADKRGADSAADVARVMLVEGQDDDAWAGGFAAAAHSAEFDAPIVLANGSELPQVTEDFLTGMSKAFAQVGPGDPQGIVLTCVTPFSACQAARAALGLPDAVQIDFDPVDGSEIVQNSNVTVTITGEQDSYTIAGDCLATPVQGTGPTTTVTVSSASDCSLTADVTLAGGATQTQQVASYIVTPSTAPPPPPPSPSPPPPPPPSPSPPPPPPPPPPAVPDQVLALTDNPSSGFAGVQPETGFSGLLQLSNVNGTSPVASYACANCSDLRVSTNGALAVYVQTDFSANGDALVVRSGPSFEDVTTISPATDDVNYDLPQFTTDGQIVVTRENVSTATDVVRFTTTGANQTEAVVANDRRLAGPDAAGPVPAVFGSGSAALVLQAPTFSTFAGANQTLSIINTNGAANQPGTDVATTPSIVFAAALSPTGQYVAYTVNGGSDIYVKEVGTAAPESNTALGAVIQYPIWTATTTVNGIDTQGSQQVDVAVSPTSISTATTALVTAEAIGRPGPIAPNQLVASNGPDALRTPSETILATFPNADTVISPHFLDR